MGGPWGRQWAHLTEIEVAANRAAENMPIFQQQRPQDPWNDLHNAAHEGSFERTVALLSRRSLDVNQRTPEGYTPLMLSAELGYSSIVRVLLDRGANVCTVANDHGLTALHLSAQNGHQNVSILLVKAGADLQATVSGSFSPLHMAAQNGRVGVATALIKAGADLQAKTIIGATPLHMAAHNGHFEVSIALMEAGSDLQATTFGGSTPLHMSCNQGDVDVVAALVEAGADVEAADPKGVKPMHLAAEKGHSAVLTALIDAGANYDTRRPSGETPLYCAVFHGHLQAVRVLLRAKANPLLTRTDTEISLVPLGFASAFGYTEVVRELLQQAGIEGCGGESGGLDALRQAAERQHVDIMTMLTDAGVTDTGGALIDAAGIGHEWSVKSLLEQKKRKCANGTAYVNSRDRNGKTRCFLRLTLVVALPGLCGHSLMPARTRHRSFQSPAPSGWCPTRPRLIPPPVALAQRSLIGKSPRRNRCMG